MVIKGYDVVLLLKRIGKDIGRNKISVYAAQMAYTLFFSLFPILLFIVSLLTLVVDRQKVMSGIDARLAGAVSPDVAGTLEKIINSVLSAKGAAGLLSFGAIVAIWSGSSIFGAMESALNEVYEVKETRPIWKRYLFRIAALIVSGIILLAATVVLLNGGAVIQWISDHSGLGPAATLAWKIVQYPIAIAFVVGDLWLLYYFLPNCKGQNKAKLLIGSAVTTVLWIAATLLFRLYVQKFHSFNPAYGVVGAVMVLLTWMYYSMFVLLAGGELNSELEKGKARVDAADRGLQPDASGGVGHRKGQGHEQAHGKGEGERAHAGTGGTGGNGNGRDHDLGRRGVFAMLRDLAEGSASLVRREVELARLELSEAAHGISMGTVQVGLGAVLAILGLLSLLAGVVLVIGDQWLPADLYWLAALIVTVLAVAGALWLAMRAKHLLSPTSLAPRELTASLAQDRQWAAAELRDARANLKGEPERPIRSSIRRS